MLCYVPYQTYFSKLSATAKESEDAGKPKDLVPADESAFWFTMQHCGWNFLLLW